MMSIAAGTAFAQLEVCAGKGYTLNSTAAAPPFGATTYQWYENSSPVGANSASYTIPAGTKAAGNYAYVRVAANVECPAGIASNIYTVRVRSAGAAGQPPDAMCDCASGLVDCSSTCTTPHDSPVDGNCTGVCNQRTVNYYTACGAPDGSGTRSDNECWQGCPPTYNLFCRDNFAWNTEDNNDTACEAHAKARATSAGARYYNWFDSSSPDVDWYVCDMHYCF
jgi:hypothetical protein